MTYCQLSRDGSENAVDHLGVALVVRVKIDLSAILGVGSRRLRPRAGGTQKISQSGYLGLELSDSFVQLSDLFLGRWPWEHVISHRAELLEPTLICVLGSIAHDQTLVAEAQFLDSPSSPKHR